MTLYFSDIFDGRKAVNGRSPALRFGSSVWRTTAGYAEQVSGWVTADTGEDIGLVYSTPAYSAENPDTFVACLKFRTPPTKLPLSYVGVTVAGLDVLGAPTFFSLDVYDDGGASYFAKGGSAGQDLALDASTDYHLVVTVVNGGCSVRVVDASRSATVDAFDIPSAAVWPEGVRLSQVSISASSGMALGSIAIADTLANATAVGGGVDAIDPDFAKVVLLVHADGAAGEAGFFDTSAYSSELTPVGGASISTGPYEFGLGALDASGGATKYLAVTPHGGLELGVADWTIETFVFVSSPANGATFASMSNGDTGIEMSLGADGTLFASYNGGTSFGGVVPSATWTHVAISHESGTMRGFVDGVQVITRAVSGAIGLPDNIFFGRGPTSFFNGFLDEIRVTRGAARYTAGFTPPVTMFAEVGPAMPSEATLMCPCPTVSASGFATSGGRITCPRPTVSAFGGASAALHVPTPILTAYAGASASLVTPALTLSAVGHDSTGENDFTYTVPRPTLSAYGGANAALSLQGPVLTITGTVTNWGTSRMSTPALTVTATGTVSGIGSSSPYLSMPSLNLIGYGGAVCSVALTGKFSVSAAGTTGAIGGAAITCPLFELTASGTMQNYGSANLLAPAARLGATAQAWLMAPGATLTAIGHAVVAATYEAYAINLNHTPKPGVEPVDETTRYSRFPFTHIVRHKNSYYGVAADGLYLLGGTTDNGVPTPYAVKTATTDFKSPYQKTVASAYLGGRLGPGATVTLHAGEGAQSQAYPYTTPRGALAQNYRQVFGKGIRHHRYYALGLSGTDVLELDNIELDTHQMTRRI